jgi:hypothetical protein
MPGPARSRSYGRAPLADSPNKLPGSWPDPMGDRRGREQDVPSAPVVVPEAGPQYRTRLPPDIIVEIFILDGGSEPMLDLIDPSTSGTPGAPLT